MNRFRRVLIGLLSMCMVFHTSVIDSFAAEEYTYTVRFYTGNHGNFTGANSVSVQGSGYSVHGDGSVITVSGLRNGDTVSFDAAMAGVVTLSDQKYYVKGIRMSGRDNNTVANPAFRVDGDRDYVVAYGITGDQTSYVVNYQDAAGRTLAPSRTYFGNVGDKPVAAYLYIDGYEPQAYNLTKTLVKNSAENIFTFIYSPVSTSSGGDEGGTTTTTTITTINVPAEGEATPEGGGAGAGGGAAAGGAGGAAGGGAAGGGGAGADAGAGDAGQVAVPDEDVPQNGPDELVDLDDEEVPLANLNDGLDDGARTFSGAIAISATAVVALGALAAFILWKKRSKKEEKSNGAS